MPDTVTVRLWAPFARSAAAHVDNQVFGMDAAGPEYWTIDLPVGAEYLLSVDGCDPRPDPRSPRQPHGVHGPSQTFDVHAFDWHEAEHRPRPVLGGVLYEVHVGTFTPEGTLDAAAARLPHLVELGVDAVEVMPLAPFPGERGWGYDGVALYAVHEPYGGPAALQRFVDAAHSLGLAVCLDVVYNHFGPSGNYTATFGPYLTDKHHTPWGSAINLDDAHADGVRSFIIDNALRWLRDFRVDALRLDAVHALVDDSSRHLLADMSDAVGDAGELIAESDLNQARFLAPTSEGGLGMDGQWADDVHHALHGWLTGERFGYYVDFGGPEVLTKALTEVFVHDGGYSTFRGRGWGAPVPAGVDRRRFVVFTQNHDQVGNRGLGDRPDARLPDGTVAGGAAILLLGPFTPLLFQGQEWGTRRPFQFFTDHEPDLGAQVTAGRAQEFAGHGWQEWYGPDAALPDPQARSTFSASTLDWSEIDEPAHARLLAWHRRLIELRRRHAAGPVSVTFGDDWLEMTHGDLSVVVAPRAGVRLAHRGRLVAAFGQADADGDTLALGAHSVAILNRASH